MYTYEDYNAKKGVWYNLIIITIIYYEILCPCFKSWSHVFKGLLSKKISYISQCIDLNSFTTQDLCPSQKTEYRRGFNTQ